MIDFSVLNARHGILGQVTFQEGLGGLGVADVANGQATASVALQGAQVLTWRPKGENPVIWLSPTASFIPGKSIRGGVPICWPWFGAHPSNTSSPSHGFARTAPWEVIEARSLADGATRLAFRMIQNEATRALWPYPSELESHITVGTTLEIELVTRNTASEAITVAEALHTYLAVSDIRQVAIQGLDGCPYVDKVDDGKRKRQSGLVTINAETDRIYLDSTADCVIDDPGWKRSVRVSKHGSRSTVMWNPWIDKAAKMGDMGEDGYLQMVCIETANAADDVVTLAPGGEHRLWARYQVQPLA